MKKLGSIIDDVLREKNCKKNSSKKIYPPKIQIFNFILGSNYINNIKGNVLESISIFDNFDFITKYEEKFEEYIKGEFKLKIEEIKEKNSKEG